MPKWRGKGRLYLYLLRYNLFMNLYIMLEGGCVYFKCITVRLEKKMSRVELRMANKDKGHPRTGHEGPEGEWRCSSTLSLPSALDGVDGQLHALAALPSGKTRYPLYRRLGGLQGWAGRVQRILPPPGFDTQTVKTVASPCLAETCSHN
jgi:hypothetical protein